MSKLRPRITRKGDFGTYARTGTGTFDYNSLVKYGTVAVRRADEQERKDILLRMSAQDLENFEATKSACETKHTSEFWDIVKQILDKSPHTTLENAKRMASLGGMK